MSLHTLEKINEAVRRRPGELEKARAAGKKVIGWMNYNVPEELIFAAGLIPVHLGTGGDDRLVEIGARYISIMNCVFTRQVVGQFSENKDEYLKNTDVLFFDVTCKQLFRVAEIVEHYFKRKVEIIGVPHNFETPAGQKYFRREIAAFAGKLESIAGKKLDASAIKDAVELFNAIRAAIRELYKWQAKPETPISWREVYEVVQAGYYLDKREYLSLLQELLQEVEKAPINPKISADSPRILISGSVIPPQDRKVLDIIESLGGRIVIDDLWSGFAPYYDIAIKTPDIEGIADAYLSRHPHASLPSMEIENDRRLFNLKKLVQDYNVDGILFHSLRYCDCFTFKANEIRSVFHENNVPFLEIHTEYAGSDFEAIRTRLEAFIETFAVRPRLSSAA